MSENAGKPDEMAYVAPTAIAPRVTTPRATVLAQALKEDTEQRAILKQYIDQHMVRGNDFGIIPGTKLPTLLKPGAEKLFDLFRCRPEYEVMSREVDREAGLYAYEIRCKAVARETDTVLNEGLGSASSYESKYRYRSAQRKCPKCGAEAIKRSQFPPRGNPSAEPGWYCHAKTGGCGSQFDAKDPAMAGQITGKTQNPDLADVANTVLKMAKKRAQVDCAIALARVSDMFTQDVEDTAPEEWREHVEHKAAVKAALDELDAESGTPPTAQATVAAGAEQDPLLAALAAADSIPKALKAMRGLKPAEAARYAAAFDEAQKRILASKPT